jgi:hypothetical protein
MIRVERSPEPPTFDERVREPGQRWLARAGKGATPGYWRRAARDLRRAFHDRCGYTADQVLDPFEVGDDWFEIKLPSCELVMTERCPPEHRGRAETMLVRLGLGRSEDVIAYRLEWYRMYLEGELTLDGLERKAPLIARAVRAQQQERPPAAS